MFEILLQTLYIGLIATIIFIGIPTMLELSNKNLRKHH